MDMRPKFFYFFLSIAIFIILWEFLAFLFPDASFLFPSLKKIFSYLFQEKSIFLYHLRITFFEMLEAMAWALLISFPFGYFMFRFSIFRFLLQPFFLIFQCVPMFTLAPLLILWFGWNRLVIILPTTIMILFPLTLQIYRGLSQTPQKYVEFFHIHHASAWKMFWKLRLPFSVPFIFSGLRISSSIAAIGAVAGEWGGGQNGLGVFIQECRYNFDFTGVYANLFCLIFLTLSFYGLVSLMELFFKRKKFIPFAKNKFTFQLRESTAEM